MPTIIDAKLQIRVALNQAGIKYFNDENYFDEFNIKFNLKGKAAGIAGYKYFGDQREYYLRFNTEAMKLNWEYFIHECIPHEIAHIICYILPELGSNHNSGWKQVCIDLGGNGEQYHHLILTPGRVTKKFMYVATCGSEIELSSIRHNKILQGHEYILRATGGKLNNNCSYKQIAC